MTENDLANAMNNLIKEMTPAKLPTNEEVFGKGAQMGTAADIGMAELLEGMTPKKLMTNEEVFGDLAKLDTTAFDELLKMITPKSLMSYDDLGKLFGLRA